MNRIASSNQTSVQYPARSTGAPVVEIGVVEVVVAPEVGGLTHATALVGHHVLESAVLGTVGIIVAQVPFAEHGGTISSCAEDVRHGRLRLPQDGPAPAGRPGAVSHGAPARHQGPARRRAEGRHVEVCEADRVVVKGIDMRRPSTTDGPCIRGRRIPGRP